METATPSASRPTLRLLFVDNIRVLLTIVVVLWRLLTQPRRDKSVVDT